MTNEQNQMDPNFDYNEWRKQGQNALDALQARKDALVAELADVEKQVKEVRKTIGAKKDGPQRFRIKPLIVKALEGKKSMKVEAIVAAVQAEKAGATPEQIVAALNRHINENENLSVVDGTIVVG
jgi:vacuolar-type H+-ATPase subunit D/Vma8